VHFKKAELRRVLVNPVFILITFAKQNYSFEEAENLIGEKKNRFWSRDKVQKRVQAKKTFSH
jgi:hypothetical protein